MKTRVLLSKQAGYLLNLTLGPHNGGRVRSQVNLWLSDSGPEWTVARLKAIRVAALQLRAGHREKAIAIYRDNSIAYFRGTCLPRGPFGLLVKSFLAANRPSTIRRWDAMLRLYTAIRIPGREPTRRQLEKSKSSINDPYSGSTEFLDSLSVTFERCGTILRKKLPRLRKPDLRRLKMFTSTFSPWGLEQQFKDFPYGKFCWSLATSGFWPERVARERSIELTSTGESDFLRQVRAVAICDWGADPATCGKITVIQEPGAKARVVAQPSAWVQWFFEPLHRSLAALVEREFPQSCVEDQASGGYWLIDKINRGQQVWCFDLSSATDRFPRKLQLALLRGLGLAEYADDLDEICSCWKGLDGEEWEYATGTPMGVYGVFPLFHLTHLLLLSTCAMHCGGVESREFVVLGDDVCISDALLASRYEHCLSLLGVPVSSAKTINSDVLGEFAGFVVCRHSTGVVAYRPYKWASSPKHSKYHSPVNFIHSLGKVVRNISPKWVRLFQEYQRTALWRHPDLSPLIPTDDEGGIHPGVVDTPRLMNLVTQIFSELDPFGAIKPEEPYDDSDDEIFADTVNKGETMAAGFARQLLSEERVADPGPKELLSTPTPSQERKAETVEKSIASDPLLTHPPRYVALTRMHLGDEDPST